MRLHYNKYGNEMLRVSHPHLGANSYENTHISGAVFRRFSLLF